MKAKFTEQRPPVVVKQFDGIDYIFIHLNETTVEQDGVNLYEYDFREIVTPTGDIDIDNLNAHPENYLDWVKPEPPTIDDLVEAINTLTDLILGTEE